MAMLDFQYEICFMLNSTDLISVRKLLIFFKIYDKQCIVHFTLCYFYFDSSVTDYYRILDSSPINRVIE